MLSKLRVIICFLASKIYCHCLLAFSLHPFGLFYLKKKKDPLSIVLVELQVRGKLCECYIHLYYHPIAFSRYQLSDLAYKTNYLILVKLSIKLNPCKAINQTHKFSES